ncbi:MAG: general secretion pathway protein B [Candidatus Azotimanducaceae bacterium]|jgi:general secretion pathway protein B
MSYILEALNKSEQERRGSQTPDLSTVHRPPPGQTARSTPWPAIVLVFALLNGIALTYWFVSNTTPDSAAQPSETATNTAAEIAPSKPKPVPNTEEAPVAFEANAVITPSSIPNLGPQPPVRITELPINVQRQVPNLVFSSHLYSDDAGFRMVNINGKMIREGDMVANDLKLLEITEGGVVLGYRHYVFEVSVLRDWSFN